MNGFWTITAVIMSFFISVVLTRILIPVLTNLKFGQTILKIGPSWHEKKQGTPTMGGIAFIAAIFVSTVYCLTIFYKTFSNAETPLMMSKIFIGLGMAVFCGIIGFLDDYLKVVKKQNLGLNPKQKLIMQFIIAFTYLWMMHHVQIQNGVTDATKINLPFFYTIDLGFFYFPICAIIIVGIINAVNLHDGVDGLCSSTTLVLGVVYLLISSILGMHGLNILTGALIGGLAGFLVWNFHPAKVFMGDTGSLFLGGIICAIGFATKLHLILILMSLVYCFEMFSVMLQVVYFKITKGKRLFKMSPIHHHFEMIGWSEVKICILFSFFVVLCGILAILLTITF